MKVRFENEKYKVTFCDKVCVESLKFILFCKRQKRRLRIVLSKESFGLYFVISVLWVLFAIVTYYLGQGIKATAERPYTIAEVFWDLKTSYFTSVILAFAINSMNRIKEYKRLIRKQHYLYVDVMSTFNDIFNQYLGDESQYYMPLYCEKTLEDTLKYVTKNASVTIDANEQLLVFDNVLKRLNELEKCYKNGQMVGTDDPLVLLQIENAQKTLTRIVINNTFEKIEELEKIATELYRVLSYTRKPWRIDARTKIKILNILDCYPNNKIQEHFYYHMLLSGHSFGGNIE